MQHTVFPLRTYNKQPSESIRLTDLCLTLVIKEDTVNGKGVCAQPLQPSASAGHRHRILAALFWLFQRRAGLSLGTSAAAPCHCPPAPARQATTTPPHHAPSEAEGCLQVFAGRVFHRLLLRKRTGRPVVHPALLSIQVSLPPSFLWRCFINLPPVSRVLGRHSDQTAQSGQTHSYWPEGQTQKLHSLPAAAEKRIAWRRPPPSS